MQVVIYVIILVEICYGSCHYLTLHNYSITLNFKVKKLAVIFPMGKQFQMNFSKYFKQLSFHGGFKQRKSAMHTWLAWHKFAASQFTHELTTPLTTSISQKQKVLIVERRHTQLLLFFESRETMATLAQVQTNDSVNYKQSFKPIKKQLLIYKFILNIITSKTLMV